MRAQAIAIVLSFISACVSGRVTYAPPDARLQDAQVTTDATAGQPDAAVDAEVHQDPVQKGCAMGLPFDIEAVLGDGDPLPPTVINSLQQAMVGDKHQLRTWFVGAGAFCLTSGTGTLLDGKWTLTSANTKLEAPLPLPHGTTIVGLNAVYIRQSSGASSSSYTMKLRTMSIHIQEPNATAIVSADPVVASENNGISYPINDAIETSPGSGHGIPYTVPSDQVGPFNQMSLRLEFTASQDAGHAPIDAQFLGIAVRATRQ